MLHYRCLAAIAYLLLLPACASIVKGRSQTIAIPTPPTDGAMCTITNAEGSVYFISPGPVTVQRSKADAEVRCSKPGWQDAVGIVPSNWEGWTVGNVILGGVIGLGVDSATGAINHYPNAFPVPMQPVGVVLPP